MTGLALVVMWHWLPRNERPQPLDTPPLRLGNARLHRPLLLGK